MLRICFSYYFVFAFMLFITSCTNQGTAQIASNRLGYNNALHSSDAQQQLLNIVRSRYMDPPYFLNVNNIVSQFSYQKQINSTVSNNRNMPHPATVYSVGAGAGVTETPTITLEPLVGKKYIDMLLTPVDFSVLYMFLHEGWGLGHILNLLVQEIGKYKNISLASPYPNWKEFAEFAHTLDEIQYAELLRIQEVQLNGQPSVKLGVSDFSRLNKKQRAMLAGIGLTRETPTIFFSRHPSNKRNEIYVKTRTVFGIFNYLSKGVEVPESDIKQGTVPLIPLKNGKVFHWPVVTKNILHVKTSKTKPKNATVCVMYRNNWFYIADDDIQSKETLDFLAIITAVYQGAMGTSAPVFTIS
ncbi:hypothetical protein [Legionella oakridgensis]|uniref:hypothetical protein n=1 Tax=Legionella oakridgensis TaxID=29423 RepID=UPI0003DE0B44|nr:hypothetical protein [Legionella oakridgensis]ETO92704.1 hypothetical protein LOR_40c04880 [Legionella oakridgensis RV-2-2007]